MSSANVAKHVAHAMPEVFQGVWSWGSGDSGQLGHDSLRDCLQPKVIALGNENFVAVSAGTSHSLALTASGKIHSWGYGGSGQLGRPMPGGGVSGTSPGSLTRPRVITAMEKNNVTQIQCGYAHTASLTDSGEVYTWGDGYWGQLGHGVEHDESMPAVVGFLSSRKALQVACGWSHTAIITMDGQLYICGRGSWGDVERMGKCNDEARFMPRRVDALNGKFVKYVACGGLHTVAITKDDEVYLLGFQNTDNQITTENNSTENSNTNDNFADNTTSNNASTSQDTTNNTGQNGGGDIVIISDNSSQNVSIEAELVDGLTGKNSYMCACGGHHSLVLTGDAEVYAFGKGEYGQLGIGAGLSSKEASHVTALSGVGVCSVACGAYHSAAVTEDGRLYVWGAGWYGQLGIGKVQLQPNPTQIVQFAHHDVRAVSCGYYHTMAITTGYLELMATVLAGRGSQGDQRLLYPFLVSGGESFVVRMHARAMEKLAKDEAKKRAAIDKLLSTIKKEKFILPQVELSHHILTFPNDNNDDNNNSNTSLPLGKPQTEIVTIANKTQIPVNWNIDTRDNNCLPTDVTVNVSVEEGSLAPGETVDVAVTVCVNAETCDDVIFPVRVREGAGSLFIVKFRSQPQAQLAVASQMHTPNVFENEAASIIDDSLRRDVSSLLVLKD